jgi:hypothetical protein
LRKKYAVERMGGKCQLCGYDKCLAALTFHHKDAEEKEIGVGVLFGYAIDKLNAELDKCILLCFNCHMELHYQGEIHEMGKRCQET